MPYNYKVIMYTVYIKNKYDLYLMKKIYSCKILKKNKVFGYLYNEERVKNA